MQLFLRPYLSELMIYFNQRRGLKKIPSRNRDGIFFYLLKFKLNL
jgi:hypothetical protein